MKKLLFALAASFALLCQAAQARPLTAPADTIQGHARMVRRMSQEMCTALNADHTTNFQTMTQEQAMAYIQKLLMPALMSDTTSLMNMARLGAQQNITPQDIGRMVGQDAFVMLRRDCPAVLPLANRFAQQPAAPAPAPAAAPKRKPATRPAGKK
jgi:hypothetical protein